MFLYALIIQLVLSTVEIPMPVSDKIKNKPQHFWIRFGLDLVGSILEIFFSFLLSKSYRKYIYHSWVLAGNRDIELQPG